MAKFDFHGKQGESGELAASCPANTSEATLYTAIDNGAVDCWLTVVNITGSAANVTATKGTGGGATANEDYIVNTYSLAARGRRVYAIGGLKPADVVKITSGTSNAIALSWKGPSSVNA
jgi:hypothetical protein